MSIFRAIKLWEKALCVVFQPAEVKSSLSFTDNEYIKETKNWNQFKQALSSLTLSLTMSKTSKLAYRVITVITFYVLVICEIHVWPRNVVAFWHICTTIMENILWKKINFTLFLFMKLYNYIRLYQFLCFHGCLFHSNAQSMSHMSSASSITTCDRIDHD